MTKPLPDCGRTDEGPCGLSDGSRRRRPPVPVARVVVSMLTTAGLIRSATSAKLTGPTDGICGGATAGGSHRSAPPASTAPAAADSLRNTSAGSRGWRIRPETISPVMKAVTAVSRTITKVNRRDIVFSGKSRAASHARPAVSEL
jgi:hypothetical protein